MEFEDNRVLHFCIRTSAPVVHRSTRGNYGFIKVCVVVKTNKIKKINKQIKLCFLLFFKNNYLDKACFVQIYFNY